MEGKTYVVVGESGAGRTTATLHLGAALERQGFNTAIVDADLNMTNLASLLEDDPDASVHDVLDGEASVNDAVVYGPDGVAVVPGEPSPGSDLETAGKWPKLKRVVEPLRAAHDVILIDSPSGLQPIHRDIMEQVDGTVLVTTPDDEAIDAAADGAKAADLLPCDPVGVVLLQTTSTTDERSIVNRIDEPALASIPESKVLTETPNYIDVGGTVQAEFEQAAGIIGDHAETGSITASELHLPVETAADSVSSADDASEKATDPISGGDEEDPMAEWETATGSSFTPPDAATENDSLAGGDDPTGESAAGDAADAADTGSASGPAAADSSDDASSATAGSTDSSEDDSGEPRTLDDMFEDDDSSGGLVDSLGGAVTSLRERIGNMGGSGGSRSSETESVNPLDELRGDDE